MSDSDIEIDESPKSVKDRNAIPLWMGILVILAFVCVTVTLALQFMEYRYFRGQPLMDKGEYATQVLIPSS